MARDKAVPTVESAKSDTVGVVFRSGFAGAAACMLAAAIVSPAGLGGMIGVAEGFGDPRASEAEAMNLPAVTQQLSSQELSSIEQALDQSLTEMEAVRAQTDAEIEHMRFVVETDSLEIRG